MEDVVCAAQRNMATRMTIQFQERYNFQHERMSGEAIRVKRARKQRAMCGFKMDGDHVKKQPRLVLPLNASAPKSKVTISSNSHPYQLSIVITSIALPVEAF